MTDQQWQTQQWPQQQGYGQPTAEASPLERAKARYADVAQPGLEPGNRPADWKEGERGRKTTWDLEDITGNPGHRGCNPNAPAEQPMEAAAAAAPPQVVAQNLPPGELHSINEPPGSDVLPNPPGDPVNLPGRPPEEGRSDVPPEQYPGYAWVPGQGWVSVQPVQQPAVRPY